MALDDLEISVGGRLYVLPPMALKQLMVAWPRIGKLGKIKDPILPRGLTPAEISSEITSNPELDAESIMTRHAERLKLMVEILVASAQMMEPSVTYEGWVNAMTLEETLQIPMVYTKLLVITGLIKADDNPLAQAPQAPQTPQTNPSTETSGP